MVSIGERVDQAITESAKRNDISKGDEYRKYGISPQKLYAWKCGNENPSANYLQHMALAGYDVNWILTGNGSPCHSEVVRCKDCKHYSKDTLTCGYAIYSSNWYPEDFCSYGERK